MSETTNDDDLSDLLPELVPEPKPASNVVRLKPATVSPDDVAKRRRFQLYTSTEIRNRPKVGYLIGDRSCPVLLEQGLWQNFGREKSGKTYYTMEMAFCVAFGIEFNSLPVKQGNVVYVIAEGSIGLIYERFEALCEKHREPLCKVLGLDKTTELKVLADAALDKKWFSMTDQAMSLVPLDRDEEKGYGKFLAEVQNGGLSGVKDIVLVVLDTWARMLWAAGGHDSDQQVVGPSIDGCDEIRKTLKCAVVMVAHVGMNKDAQKRPKGLGDPTGAIDGATRCWKEGEGASATFHFEAAYQRFAADGFKQHARIEPVKGATEALSFYTKAAAEQTVKLTPKHRAVLFVLTRLGPDGVTEDDWRAAVVDAKVFSGEADSARRGFDRALIDLEKKDVVTEIAGLFYTSENAPPKFDDDITDDDDDADE